jgi:hypothetical protein
MSQYGPQNFDQDPSNAMFSPSMRNYGNPMINLMAQMMTGYNYMPERQNGQSMYEALLHRERSKQFMGLQRSAFANNPIFQNLGIEGSSTLGMLGGMMASPDSLTGRAMGTALGGNPMAASMQLYAGMAGANTMGAFGQTSAITMGETEATMQSLAENFYKTKKYEGPGGNREVLRKENQEFFEKQLARGKEGVDYLNQLGYQGMELDPEGKPTEATKKRIKDIDITAGPTESKETRQQVAQEVNKDITALLKESDQDIKKSLDERLEKQLIARRIATKKQLDAARDDKGVLDPGKLSNLISNYTEKGTESEDATRIRNQIAAKTLAAGDVASGIEEIKRSGKDKTALAEANSKMEKILTSNNLVKPDELKSYKDKEGNFDLAKVQKISEGLNTRTADESAYMRSAFQQQQGKTFTNYNFEKSRGFKLEDFTSAYYKAADVRALGDSKNISAAEGMRRFSSNAGGAMDAARSVFGNKSGAELISSMSDLAGSSEMDLTTQEGSGKMEDLLRKVKATQKVAGVSIQTMLAVINSAKELAANNPQLQYMNGTATTETAMRAVSTAADMGRVMGGKEYRQAGGSQAIAGDIIKEEQAFAQSGLGGAATALLAATKGTDAYDTVKEMIQSGNFTGRDLDRGGMEQIAKKMGVSIGEVAYIMQNKQLQQEGLQDEETAKIVTEGTQKNASKSFFQAIQSAGLNKDELMQKYKESQEKGESYEQFKSREITAKLGTEEQQQVLRTYSKAIQKEFQDSLRSPEEKKRYDELVERQASEDKRMSKELAGLNAPPIQQALGALMTGKELGLDAGAEAMAGIFATKDTYSSKTKKIVDDAKQAGAKMLGMAGKQGEEVLKKEGFVDELNKVRQGSAAQARERGDTAAAELLEKQVSAEDLTSSIDTLKKSGLGSASDAAGRLADLRAQKEQGKIKGGSSEERVLKALETAETTMGGIKDDAAFKQYISGGLRGSGAAVIQSQVTAGVEDVLQQSKKQDITHMGERLEKLAGSSALGARGSRDQQEIKEAMQHYTKDGKVDYAAMMEDAMNPSKKKKAGEVSNFFGEKQEKRDEQTKQMSDAIAAEKEAQKDQASDTPEKRNARYAVMEQVLTDRGVSNEELAKAKNQDGTYDISKIENLKKKTDKNLDDSALRDEIAGTKKTITDRALQAAGAGQPTPEDASKNAMVDVFKNLTQAIQGKNSISEMLEKLVTALQK